MDWDLDRVQTALARAIATGETDDWMDAVHSARVPDLVTALARSLESESKSHQIILRSLIATATSERRVISSRVNRELSEPHKAAASPASLRHLRTVIDEVFTPTPSGQKSKSSIAERVAQACQALGIRGRIHSDILALDFDEDAIGAGVGPGDLPAATLRDLAAELLDRARSKQVAPARRARLYLQSLKLLLLLPAPEEEQRSIFNNIGSYCCRQAQAFSDERRSPDVAQDYALEAIAYQSENLTFPVALYFHTAKLDYLQQLGALALPTFNANQRKTKT